MLTSATLTGDRWTFFFELIMASEQKGRGYEKGMYIQTTFQFYVYRIIETFPHLTLLIKGDNIFNIGIKPHQQKSS